MGLLKYNVLTFIFNKILFLIKKTLIYVLYIMLSNIFFLLTNEFSICINNVNMCVILNSNNFFFWKIFVNTFFGTTNINEGSRRTTTLLPKDTKLHIKKCIYYFKYNRNLLSFKDIGVNRCHINFDKNFVLKNYQFYLIVCTTYILIQLKHMPL